MTDNIKYVRGNFQQRLTYRHCFEARVGLGLIKSANKTELMR